MSNDEQIQIRNDIFPNLGRGFGSRDAHLKIWIGEAYNGLNAHFTSLMVFIQYVNNINSKENAEQFIRLCQFYNSSKNYVDNSFTKLIMILSIIESIISKGKKYRPFKDWILGQKNLIESRIDYLKEGDVNTFIKIIEEFKTVYHSEYGSTRNVVDFFHKYMTIEDKVSIIKSFRYKNTKVVSQYSEKLYEKIPHMLVNKFGDFNKTRFRVSEELMPLCYNWRCCYVDYGHCYPNIGSCLLMENEGLMFNTLKRIINIIYTMRSDFVHNAKMPGISEKGIDFTSTVYKGKLLMIELNIADLEELFERGFLAYYDLQKK